MRHATRIAVVVCAGLAAVPAQGFPNVMEVGPGCGAAQPGLRASVPVLHTSVEFEVTSSAATWGVLAVSFPPSSPTHVGAGCVAYVDPATAVVLGILPTGGAQRLLDLPADPAWLGVTLRVQALTTPSAAAIGFDLTPGLEVTIGQRAGPLAGLPSPAGAHTTLVAGMAPNSWLDLGVPQPDPVHGLATGREYTPRMAWSEALQGAFLTGESGHGYVNTQTGRYVDDVWFYDWRGHAWRCVKPGSAVATLALQLDGNQFEIDGQGQLVPVAQLGHGYEFVAFDDWTETFFMQPAPNTYWVASMPQRLGWLPNGNASFPASQYRSPWLFQAVTGSWRREPVGANAPNFNVSARGMAVQAIDGRFWVFDTAAANRSRIWWFDPVTYAWHDEPTANPAPAIVGHGITCHDPVHGRVYYYGVDATSQTARLWYYDVATRGWHHVNVQGTPPHSVVYTTSGRGLLYDAGDDAVLLWMSGGSNVPVVHRFDVGAQAWAAPVSPPAAMRPLFAWRHVNGFSVPSADVHVFHVAGGNAGTGRMIVYRH